MSAHTRKSHFLGTKLRALRKRNGLTLEELSTRCIQLDAQPRPSVSYLSMIESGKRVPSEEVLELLSQVFQREPRWFLDGNPEIEAPGGQRSASGGAPACRSSRRSCSPRSCCRRRSPSCWRRPAPPGASSPTC